MNVLDLILIVVMLYSAVRGFSQGLIKSLISLIGWVLALICATQYTDHLAPSMTFISHDHVVQKVTAFLTIIAIFMALMWGINLVLNKIIQTLKLDPINRLMGGMFGVIKSLFIILIVIQGVAPWISKAQFWKHSVIVYTFLPYTPLATEVSKNIADEAIQHFQKDENRLKQRRSEHSEQVTENPFH